MSHSDADASELTFQGLIEDIGDKFRNNIQLDDTALISIPIQVTTVTDKSFGSVLCHYTEMELSVTERKS